MARRKIEYQETYIKGITTEKEEIARILEDDTLKIHILKVGRYNDNTEFLTIRLEVETKLEIDES